MRKSHFLLLTLWSGDLEKLSSPEPWDPELRQELEAGDSYLCYFP